MKKTTTYSLLAVAALSAGILTACATSEPSNSSAKSAEVFTGATAGTDKFETLAKGFGDNGAWLNALTKDLDASDKTLTVSGVFAGDGVIARELALYKSNPETHQPDGTYTLTLKKLNVQSPGFAIAQGTVKSDVYVSASGFHFEGTGKIEGNLIFASEELKTAFDKLPDSEKGTVTGDIKVESAKLVSLNKGAVTVAQKGGKVTFDKVADVKSGATAGTDKFDTLQAGFGKDGAWLNATKGDLDASGKTLKVNGTFVNGTDIARKLALYDQNDKHQVTKTYTLTLDKLEVASPNFYIANGTVKGDVYVAKDATGFKAQNGKDTSGNQVTAKIDGNLYFATQEQLDAYNKLDASAKYEVTGQTAVKA